MLANWPEGRCEIGCKKINVKRLRPAQSTDRNDVIIFLLTKYWNLFIIHVRQSTSKNVLTVAGEFISVQSLDRLGRREDMRDDSAEVLFRRSL